MTAPIPQMPNPTPIPPVNNPVGTPPSPPATPSSSTSSWQQRRDAFFAAHPIFSRMLKAVPPFAMGVLVTHIYNLHQFGSTYSPAPTTDPASAQTISLADHAKLVVQAQEQSAVMALGLGAMIGAGLIFPIRFTQLITWVGRKIFGSTKG